MYAKLPIDPSVATTKEIEDTELSLIDPDLSDLVPEFDSEL